MTDPIRTATTADGTPTASLADTARFRAMAETGVESPAVALGPFTGDLGRYVLGAEIARGGMGVVYRATDTALGREVAIKVLSGKYAPASGTARRFADEARITAQLQHPGIPPVFDLGTLPDGLPFLAMKLIKGDTLDDLLKHRPDPAADRGRFVAAFEKVCEAVGYAHAHSVLHRDLKPGNVMVGSFGEVQVMDWGLAKVLEGAAAAARADADATAPGTAVRTQRDSDDLLTQAGSVLGTPAYMPPEQAVGAVHEVDRRSDVFGLGGILAAVLTGRPPFVGDTAETTRVMAARGQIAGCFERLDGCGADPELVALAKRCLAPARADRPADAGEVAAAVHALRAAADERARRAEADRERAETRAAEQRKRRRVVQWAGSGVLAAVVAGAVVAGWQWRRAADSQRETAAALADLTDEQGRTAAALGQVSRERERLREEKKNTVDALNALSDEVVESLFASRPQLGEREKAFLRRVIDLYDRATAVDGESGYARFHRAQGRYHVAQVRAALGDPAGAEADLLDARRRLTALADEFPDDDRFIHTLANVRRRLGRVYEKAGRADEAAAEYRFALNACGRLAADHPDEPGHRYDWALTRHDLSGLLFDRGRVADAEAEAVAARDLLVELTRDHPGRTNAVELLASVRHHLGVMFGHTGRVADAEREYRAVLAVREGLVAAEPDAPDPRARLAVTYTALGDVTKRLGRPAEAEDWFRRGCDLRRRLAADFPTVPMYRDNLARAMNDLGVYLREQNRPREAEAEYLTARDLRAKLAADFPAVPNYRNELAGSHNNLGVLYRQLRREADAEREYRAAIDLRAKLVADFPTVVDYRNSLASTRNNLGNLYHATGRPAEAEAELAAAIDLRAKLVAEVPTMDRIRNDLARNQTGLAVVYQTTGRPDQAAELYAAALGHRRELVKQQPGITQYRHDLATTLTNLGALHAARGEHAAARERLEEAEPHHRAALKANPRNAEHRGAFRGNRYNLLSALVELGDHTAVPPVAAELLEYTTDRKADAYHAGGRLAVCAGRAADRPTADRLADLAVTHLRQAVANGWKDARDVRTNPDLDPLRDRDDFKKLLAQLEGTSSPKREVLPAPRKE